MTIRTLGALAGVALSAAGVAAAPVWSTDLGDPGLSGSYVASFAVHDDGSGEALYATGQFSIPGVPGGSNLARWNGSAWEAVGGGLQAQYSNAMATFQGDLILAGYFDTAGNVPGTAKLARWDGQNWNSMDAQAESFLNSMWDIAVHDDGSGEALYIAGNYVNLNGQTGLDHIARWDGENYTAVGGTIGGAVPLIVLDIHSADLGDGAKLYAGGRFLTIGGVPALNIAVWDGQGWSDLAGGLTRPSGFTQVLHMVDWDGDLYVGGRFEIAGGAPVSRNIARWDGSAWHSVGAGFDGDVQELAVFDDGSGETLYAMGNFNNSGSTPTPRIAKWNGTSWEAVGAGANGNVFGAIVYDLGDGPALHMGGGFSSVDGQVSNRVVSLLADAGCPADLTGDGQLNFFDVAAFLDLYNASDPGADWNNDGLINFFDLAAYLDDFNAGCP
ncbi:MAG: hypothetical protein LAT64_10960 [Phycisphaerales bacterium]|nr:hypothetical protein [Planctomycetota bacterium]MCH8509270.1 hypothetical protein [Phycisphaerales bacterium]